MAKPPAPRNLDLIKTYITLVYEAALLNEPAPTKLHIRFVLTPTLNNSAYHVYRSINHDTTVNTVGEHVLDPDGEHLTFNYKNASMVVTNTHVTTHAYHYGSPKFHLRKATFDNEKRDDTPRKTNKKKKGSVCWPDEAMLEYLGEFIFQDGVLVDQDVP